MFLAILTYFPWGRPVGGGGGGGGRSCLPITKTVAAKQRYAHSCPGRSLLVQTCGLVLQTVCAPPGSHETSRAGYKKQNFVLVHYLWDAR